MNASGGSSVIRVLCVDDVPEVTRAFQRLLAHEPGIACVGVLDRADDLVGAVERLTPDIVLLDLTMPGKDPLDALREVSERTPSARVIVFSGYDDQATIDGAVEAGAWGVVSKDQEFGAVVAAVRRVAKGEALY